MPRKYPEESAAALSRTREAIVFREEGEPLPIGGAVELREALLRVERRGVLDGSALRDVAKTLGAARALRKFLGRRSSRAPALYQACSLDPQLDHVEVELSECIEPDGSVSDRASAEIRRLRVEVKNLRGRIVRKLEQLVIAKEAVMQDRFHTIREGRYVVPVRRDAHEKISGIVHGTSQSGATVFIEPRVIVEQGNRLKMAQAELDREIARILAALSELVFDHLRSIVAATDAIDLADLHDAAARLAEDIDGVVVELVEESAIELKEARHPLLALEHEGEVVPNDLSLRAGEALVISGPNAGGKTVALKTLGLCALMVRAGLPIPAREGRSGFFTVVSDVGDEQSTERNLSTFSAHVKNLAAILAQSKEGVMVLLDELAGGTDPAEGASLACAYVDALCRAGAATAVTTHYEPLKAYAAERPALRNAAVGFDFDTLSPTFRLAWDVPGASSALIVAARYGIPDEVIAHAKEILPTQAARFEALVAKLSQSEAALVDARSAVERERVKMSDAREALEREHAAQRRRDQKTLDRESAKLKDAMQRARGELKAARRAMRERADEEQLEKARQAIESAEATRAAAAATPEPEEPSEGPETLAIGQDVYVPRLRAAAKILELGTGRNKDRLRVAAGALTLWVNRDEVKRANNNASRAKTKKKIVLAPAADSNTLDLRGLRVDEALAMTEAFLDRMFGASEKTAYLVHGVGTGALKAAVHEFLGRDAHYVSAYRYGTQEEGGERLTIVSLK